ncbi:MAG TPA: protein-glutamate O-methyltransferase CheR [Leptospiraceae bacterium]|nr:protein-glutamate O-methyltransferase CheR [Leptospiraceae bacterium]
MTRIKTVIRAKTGVIIDDKNEYLIGSRLGILLEENNLSSFDELADVLAGPQDSPIFKKFLERITTHETRFFRDESTFAALVEQMIPEWMERNRSFGGASRPLNIWCAAGSTGQEAYSIAMLIHSKFPQIFPSLNLVSTDISETCVERASAGFFTDYEMNRGVSDELRAKFFVRVSDKGYNISSEIRSKVEFKQQNLLVTPYAGKFDIVFCRNVLIYFDLAVRKQILEGFQRVILPDGFLVLGATESPTGLLDSYVVRQFGLTRYYEINSTNITFAPAQMR